MGADVCDIGGESPIPNLRHLRNLWMKFPRSSEALREHYPQITPIFADKDDPVGSFPCPTEFPLKISFSA